MKSVMVIFFGMLFNQVVAQSNLTLISLDSLVSKALSKEIDPVDYYFEQGILELNMSDLDSYYVEKRKTIYRYKVDRAVLDTSFFEIEATVDNLIPLLACCSQSTSKIDDTHIQIPYVRFRGKLIVIVNHSSMNVNQITVNTGDIYLDSYLLTVFKLAR